MRPFTLLQRSLTLRRPPAAGSTLLAYIFEIVLGPRLTRSASRSRPHPAFFRPAGRDRCESPVANFTVPELSVCPRTATPLQDLSILRDHSTQPVSTRKSLPLRVARFAFAPRGVCNNELPLPPRITAPAPLLPAWLTLLRTSWNQRHHAPGPTIRQAKT